jgi:anthranilate phosphoribosyltransferase
MKQLIEYLLSNGSLSRQEAKNLFIELVNEKTNNSQISSILTIYRMRLPTADELCGFREAALELSEPIDLGKHKFIDVCGTGGDGKGTFNISTLTAIVVAASGIKVVKHGGNAVSSRCGSSNILESLGYVFSKDQNKLEAQLDRAGICFLHAPLFHPSFGKVAPIRKELGIKTVFNMLGPLVNPARPMAQVCGVYSKELLRLYSEVAQKEKLLLTAVFTLDVCDEISLTSDAFCAWPDGIIVYQPGDFGFKQLRYSDIAEGASIEDSVKIFNAVLNNEATEAQRNVVLANSAVAIRTAKLAKGLESSLLDCVTEAKEALCSGKAKKCFEKLLNN